MSSAAVLFCDRCGAANRVQASFCRCCGQMMHVPATSISDSSASASSTLASSTLASSTLTGLLNQQCVLKQRYVILGLAGRGGFGAVYKAADSQFGNRLVAIKEMSQSNLSVQELAEATAAFKQEALLLANLTHPNLPRIYEQFTDSGRSYLVMDFIDGETLEAYLSKQHAQPVPVALVLTIALQLCSVLDYLHTRQPPIIFRDLKPANIMLTTNKHAYLIDFGIARHFKPGQKKDTAALGSSGYAAPEQYGKSQTTPRSDIYSLGATLHQMLSGDDPAETPFRFAPLELSPQLKDLAALVMSMVSIDRNSRPASATQVMQVLQRMASLGEVKQTYPLPYTLSVPAVSGSVPAVSGSVPAVTMPPLPVRALPTSAAVKKTSQPGQAAGPRIRPQVNMLYACLGHKGRIAALAWSPDGKYLASASYDKTVRVWQAAHGQHYLVYRGHSGRVNDLSWSPDSKYLVSASDDQTVQIWDVTTGKAVYTYRDHAGGVNAVAWSPDGAAIASAGSDKAVQVWHASLHRLLSTHHNTDTIWAVAWSPDSRYLASGCRDSKVCLWTPSLAQRKRSLWRQLFTANQDYKLLQRHSGPVYAVAWSPDGRYLVSAGSDHKAILWNLHAGKAFFTEAMLCKGVVNSVAWSPDSKHVALASNDKTVQIWEVTQRSPSFVYRAPSFVYRGHSGYVNAVAWSPDGSRVASAGVDRTLQVWQAV
jgi:tRNA A-37 threonylcarbamoyl transferase component Bud32